MEGGKWYCLSGRIHSGNHPGVINGVLGENDTVTIPCLVLRLPPLGSALNETQLERSTLVS